MNKPRNQFATLSEQDRKHILDLCSKHPYDEVVPLLAKPRSEHGLDIVTSKSALCRFFTSSHVEPRQVVLAQYATAAQVRHEQDSNAFLGAIRVSVEARVLESLKNGKALADMEKDFRLLKTAENLYLADAKWRSDNPKAARAAYQQHVERCAESPDIDFVPVTESRESKEAMIEFSPFERDVAAAREKQRIAAEQRLQLLAQLKSCGIGPEHLPAEYKTRPIPPSEPAKSTVIPHIPPDPTSPAPTRATSEPPQPPQPPPPSPETPAVPFLRPHPKIGRNDPCPCGSGHKYKKCCLLKSSLPLAA
jgi:hypothetical protein